MKFELEERQYGMELILTPESVEDTAKLLRFSNNAKAEKPSIYMAFGNQVCCYVTLKKLCPAKQTNSINPFRKKK